MRGILLDVDGTLLDSNEAHARAWVEAIQGVGVSLPFARVRERIGEGGEKLLWELLGLEQHSPAGEHVAKMQREIFRSRFLADLKPTPGARELLERLRAEGLKLVVATSAGEEELAALLVAACVKDFIEDAVTKDDAPGRSKPDPDIVEAAIAKAGLPCEELLMLGDTPYDIEAATRAGVATIALECGGWSKQALAAAAAVYKDPSDLLAHYADSPLCWRAASRSVVPPTSFRGGLRA
jgi:HAD superfamily hydrolase (TIGR01509 family)